MHCEHAGAASARYLATPAAAIPVDHARFFADADIFHPSPLAPYRAWGATGMRLLRRMEAATMARLDDAGYVEIRLPSICPAAQLERFLGSHAERLIHIASDRGERLTLTPFADLQYVNHVCAARTRAAHRNAIPERAFLWSRALLVEAGSAFLDFGEYAKCEVFSLHRQPRQALRTWEELNDIYRCLCVDDFDLDVIWGQRPAVTAFPLTARTFAVELSQGPYGFQTVIVSHVMAPTFMTENGFSELAGALLNSACFSQKLLAGLLLHHRDEWGLRVPPVLAPSLGVLVGRQATSIERLRERPIATKHRLCRRPDQRDAVQAMIDAGAAWSLAAEEDSDGRSVWLLYRRGALNVPPQRHASPDSALQSADRYVETFAEQLRSQSRQRTRVALGQAMSCEGDGTAAGDRGGPINRVLPCCGQRCCQAALAGAGLPKLLCRLERTLPCASCGRATASFILFEREELYTSFYVPPSRALGAKPRPRFS